MCTRKCRRARHAAARAGCAVRYITQGWASPLIPRQQRQRLWPHAENCPLLKKSRGDDGLGRSPSQYRFSSRHDCDLISDRLFLTNGSIRFNGVYRNRCKLLFYCELMLWCLLQAPVPPLNFGVSSWCAAFCAGLDLCVNPRGVGFGWCAPASAVTTLTAP